MRYPMNRGLHSQVWEVPPTISLSRSGIKKHESIRKLLEVLKYISEFSSVFS